MICYFFSRLTALINHIQLCCVELSLKISDHHLLIMRFLVVLDARTVRMVNAPKSPDTIVGTNRHLDIPSNLAAALACSIGVAPSSTLDPTRKSPLPFEPVH
jgi:isocitrate/isopropylmalate dehydrogenase